MYYSNITVISITVVLCSGNWWHVFMLFSSLVKRVVYYLCRYALNSDPLKLKNFSSPWKGSALSLYACVLYCD